MAKLKVTKKGSQVIVESRLARGEEINDREVAVFSSKLLRGLMRPEVRNKKKLVYTALEVMDLKDYLKSGLNKEDFFLLLAQIVEAVKRVNYNSLYINNLVLDLRYVFINKTTRELFFIYQPLISRIAANDIFAFISDILYSTVFHLEVDTSFVAEIIAILKGMNTFIPGELEAYITKACPSVYKLLPKQASGKSGFITNDPLEYEKHYNGSHFQESNGDEGTTLLDFDEGTTLLEEEEGTTLLTEDYGTVLLEEEEVVYPYLIRIQNDEKIVIDRESFKIGKDRNLVDYCVDDNKAVSRSHAHILSKNGGYFVYDNNSTNKTYIDEEIVPAFSEVPIYSGSRLRLGNEEFDFFL
ncbi:FHA domain-containing protein [Alloiococcus sp. CFN-8]|uniref:FHA domain-containing protein n=1 Tax=Alloiococcus sp. CFN-8 TaxID=3416081 RepID=UPI003CE8B526